MATVSVRTSTGAESGKVDLDQRIFGIEPNVAVMHQVVTAQLAARRAGTQSTKTRAEVRGGGAKPWRQKGTGRARQGSIRSPQWRGGGVALGPKPRSYAQSTPKKMVSLALRSALSDRATDDKIVVIDDHGFSSPRTKDAIALLAGLGLDGRILLVLPAEDEVGWKSFRNLPQVQLLAPGQLNAYDVLVNDWILFTRSTLPSSVSRSDVQESVVEQAAARPVAARPVAARPVAAKRVAAPKPASPDTPGAGEQSPDQAGTDSAEDQA